jgi:hypothetical protein
LFFFIRKCTPATRPSATLRLRSNAAPKSKVTSPLIPKVLASLFRVAQQRFRRDAADVEADAAPVFRFDDGGVQPELGSANGCDVTTGACSENDDVIVSHDYLP